MNDHELLRAYVRQGSERAFTELVEQHVNLVYSAALRTVRDPDGARDVTQEVFALLSRKAARLGTNTILSAWLYRAAVNCGRDHLRGEFRRMKREEMVAQTMNLATQEHPWAQIEPFLDDSMGALEAADQDVLVLRFFENKSFREIGDAIAISEDAAQKRVSRALDRLRQIIARNGINASSAGLGIAIAEGAAAQAPAGLAASSSSFSLAANSSVGLDAAAITAPASKVLAVGILITSLAIVSVVLFQENRRLGHELASVRQPSAIQTPRSETKSTRQPPVDPDEFRRLQRGQLELLSLRGRYTQLADELMRLKSATAGLETASQANRDESPADSILFSANLTNTVPNGSTLVVGGWTRGKLRGYLMLTATVDARRTPTGPDRAAVTNGPRTLTVESVLMGAPETFWRDIGWGGSKSDMHRSTLATVLKPDQMDLLLNALKDCEGAGLSNSSKATREDGEFIGIGFSSSDDEGDGALLSVEVYPRIAADGKSVSLELRPSGVSADIQIHKSLTRKSSNN